MLRAQSDASPRAPICQHLYVVFIINVHCLRILVTSQVWKEHLEGEAGPHVFLLCCHVVLGGQDCLEGEGRGWMHWALAWGERR